MQVVNSLLIKAGIIKSKEKESYLSRFYLYELIS
jgi:hypothetical protein